MKKLLLAAAAVAMIATPLSAVERLDPTSLIRQAPGLRAEVLNLAMDASRSAVERGLIARSDLLTVIDYSIPSSQPRLFVLDLAKGKVLFRELVAHGKNSGGDRTTSFSNESGSLETSIGLFATAGTYQGNNGYSLRLRGLERGVNDNAIERAIVIHGAEYVSEATVQALGRLGRSWGCPAVRSSVAKKLIDTIRGGSAVFSYYPDPEWLSASSFLARPSRQASAGVSAAR